MRGSGPLASVVLLTFNGESYLREVLDAVGRQKASFDYEVLVIDSGSRDGTLDILRSYAVNLHQIPNSEFNHGETRNLGARLSRGRFVAYLTQDSTPADEHWLQYLVDAFDLGPKVGAVYGLHLPRPDCDPVTRRDTEEFFKMMGPVDRPTIRSIKEGEEGWQEYLQNEGIIGFFSDVNSCLRKSVWKEIPYRPLDYAEDQALGRDVLRAGYWKVYEPRAAVVHSHSYPLLEYFRRQFDEYRGLRRSIGFTQTSGLARVFLGALKGGSVDSRYVWRKKYSLVARLKWTLYAYAMNLLRRMAGYLAAREHRLPRRLARTISLEAQARKKSGGAA
jgi:glycosyltransferase involved in cell wall biosynthesis